MYDIAHCQELILYKEFGINARLLIDHANGIEPCTIKDIKSYRPKSTSISNNQILYEDYSHINARKVLIEMIDNLTLQLVKKNLYTESVGFIIGYSKDIIPPLKITKKLNKPTISFSTIVKELLIEYDYMINPQYKIRRIGIYFHKLAKKKSEQLDLFSNSKLESTDQKIEQTMLLIKNKYGNNSILRGISYDKYATQRKRNKLIGGHNAE